MNPQPTSPGAARLLLTLYAMFALAAGARQHKRISTVLRFRKGYPPRRGCSACGAVVAVVNGPVEGRINRLKLLKRQAYGCAKLDLLRIRLLAS